MKAKLKCPFPYYGGKAPVAQVVWDRLGDVDNYIECFCGSAATLLARPTPPKIETVNDADVMIANFWRATKHDPEAVAEWADWPVNEADLHAVHRWLVLGEEAALFRKRMREDPDYYDAKRAGRWVWGLCMWIGSGWCQTAASSDWGQMPLIGDPPRGVHRGAGEGLGAGKSPRIDGGPGQYGHGVHAKGEGLRQKRPRSHGEFGTLPGIHSGDKVVRDQRPHLGASDPREHIGIGVHGPAGGNRPQLADAYARGRGVHGHDDAGTCAQRRAWLLDWFGRLRDRLRTVRVCCGHWLRVCDSESVTTRLGITGMMIDPPYAHDVQRMLAWVKFLRGEGPEPAKKRKASNRHDSLYANDRAQDVDRLVAEVHVYCAERGAMPSMRIALAGYDGEHNALEEIGWECYSWHAAGGYGNRSEKGKANAKRERIWFSPHAVTPPTLFKD